MSQVQSKQVFDSTFADTLDNILQSLKVNGTIGSFTLPNGVIVKVGTTGAFSSIGANAVDVETVTFPIEFPTSCDFFFAVLTPGTSTDFYGVTSIVSQSKTAVQFTVKNGATAQTVAGGYYIAIGK